MKQSAVKLETSAPVKDPAGLDELLLAAGKGLARFVERWGADKLGRPVNIWDGVNGLGAVLTEHIEAAGIPNKRLPELVTPRSISGAVFGPAKTRRPRRRVR